MEDVDRSASQSDGGTATTASKGRALATKVRGSVWASCVYTNLAVCKTILYKIIAQNILIQLW